MKPVRLSRTLHKWFALLVGVQLLLWTVSGFYMVAVHIDWIHGDMLVRNINSSPQFALADLEPVNAVLQNHPTTHTLKLTTLLGKAVYQLEGLEGRKLVDAHNGDLLSPVSREYATTIAKHYYAGDSDIAAMALITSNPPGEVRFLTDPVWRIDFDDVWGSSFYIDAASGKFVTRRHTLWRVFDFLWMLHIMDYETRGDINTVLLKIAAGLGLLVFAPGAWLLYFRLGFGRRKT
jgi:uncharacterized iron-regulated membrane protein